MEANKIKKNDIEVQEKEMSPEEVVDYIIKLGTDIANSAQVAKDMMKIAEQRRIEFNIEEVLKPFHPLGKKEVELVNLRASVNGIGGAIASQGVNITYEELNDFQSENTQVPAEDSTDEHPKISGHLKGSIELYSDEDPRS